MTDAWPEIVAKAIVYAGVITAVGAEAALWLLVPRARRAVASTAWATYGAQLDRAAATAAGVVLAGLVLRVWAHTIVAFGFGEALSWSNLVIVGFESRWGRGWRIQVAAATILLVSADMARSSHPRAGRALCAVAAVALCGVLPLTGHAAGIPWRTTVHALHLLGGGLWIGTLAVVVTGRSGEARELRPHLLKAFAPLAMTGAAALAMTGAIVTWTYLGALANLWQTAYGRLLAAKLGLVGGVALVGGLNWRQLHRSRTPVVDERRVQIEVALAIGVVLVTAWLTETPHHPEMSHPQPQNPVSSSPAPSPD